jgi:hypothetical protein
MYSGLDTFIDNWKYEPEPEGPRSQFQSSKVGCPIRKSTDQRLFAPTRSLSQRTTSFFASYRQGIHQMLFGHLIALISNAHRVLPPRPPRREAASSERTFGSRCALHRKTRSHQDKPNPEASLALSSRDPPHRPLAQLMLLGCDGVYASAQEYPLFTMSRLPAAP